MNTGLTMPQPQLNDFTIQITPPQVKVFVSY
jgi:hypothetical protein